MRAYELMEDDEFDSDEFYDKLQKQQSDFYLTMEQECMPFLKANYNFLPCYRGMQDINPIEPMLKTVRLNRNPLSTGTGLHLKFVQAFKQAGFIANRDNSIFCTGSISTARSYGNAFCIIPRGEFHITWSPKIKDLYNQIHSLEHKFTAFNFDELTIEEKNKCASRAFQDIVLEISLLKGPLVSEFKNYLGRKFASKSNDAFDAEMVGIQRIMNYTKEEKYALINEFIKNIESTALYKEVYRDKLGQRYQTTMELKNDTMTDDERIDTEKLSQYLKETYRNDEFSSALENLVEIMIHCKDYWVVPTSWWHKLKEEHNKRGL